MDVGQDVTQLVQTFTHYLGPALPYLLASGAKFSEKASEKLGESLGSGVVEKVKRIWGKLWTKMADKPAALEAAQDVAQAPDDEDKRAALRVQLKKLLVEDAELAKEVEGLIKELQMSGSIVTVTGDRAVGFGDNATNTIVITGNDSKIERD